jgi:hypothetical protein
MTKKNAMFNFRLGNHVDGKVNIDTSRSEDKRGNSTRLDTPFQKELEGLRGICAALVNDECIYDSNRRFDV